jgi:hypothetical protein
MAILTPADWLVKGALLFPQPRCASRGRERGRKATGWTIAWGAWSEQTMDQGVCCLRSQVREIKMRPVKVPKPCEAKDEEEREQEQEGMKSHKLKGHNNPRCLKWGAWRDPVSGRIRRIERDCQAIGREVRIIHHRETLYRRKDRNSCDFSFRFHECWSSEAAASDGSNSVSIFGAGWTRTKYSRPISSCRIGSGNISASRAYCERCAAIAAIFCWI